MSEAREHALAADSLSHGYGGFGEEQEYLVKFVLFCERSATAEQMCDVKC